MKEITIQTLIKYIEHREMDIKAEQKRIHILPPERREMMRRQLRGRRLELNKLRGEMT
jgi:hypothetical protein